ncbi:MAG: hypothetical protein JOY66_07910, partial [Acetobacteraceae bacterium]|nr:hypothetical protein [Acetobacteraceae bacterium]
SDAVIERLRADKAADAHRARTHDQESARRLVQAVGADLDRDPLFAPGWRHV